MHEKLNVSRRGFLVSASALGIAGLAGSGASLPRAGSGAGHRDLTEMTCTEFAACLGSTFRVCAADTAITVELIRARELRRACAERGEVRNPFALLFRGGPAERLPQGTYRMDHERLGAIKLFIVPVGMGSEPVYEAVFG
jgi:hypothetical protein